MVCHALTKLHLGLFSSSLLHFCCPRPRPSQILGGNRRVYTVSAIYHDWRDQKGEGVRIFLKHCGLGYLCFVFGAQHKLLVQQLPNIRGSAAFYMSNIHGDDLFCHSHRQMGSQVGF